MWKHQEPSDKNLYILKRFLHHTEDISTIVKQNTSFVTQGNHGYAPPWIDDNFMCEHCIVMEFLRMFLESFRLNSILAVFFSYRSYRALLIERKVRRRFENIIIIWNALLYQIVMAVWFALILDW